VHRGTFEFNRLPFGLKSAPWAFQQTMSIILRDCLWQYALCFIDDILVYSSDFNSHILHLTEVFARLRKANMKLHMAKCKFAAKTVRYLGHLLSKDGIYPDPKKVEAVRTYPQPKNQKEVRSFLGLVGFYRKYIHQFALKADSLHKLLRKDAKFVFDDECVHSFNTLRTALINSPILALPNFNRPFIITTDASTASIAYVLSQNDDRGQEHVISYGGRSLRNAEKQWSVTDIEGLALIESIREYHVYLANQKFTVFTDHIALCWLKQIKYSQGRLLRWSLLLQGYDFDIIHVPGKRNAVADALSRRTYPAVPDELQTPSALAEDDILSILLPESDPLHHDPDILPATVEQPYSHTLYETTIEYYDTNILSSVASNTDTCIMDASAVCALDNLPSLQRDCPDLLPIIEYLESQSLPDDDKLARRVILQSEQFVLDDDGTLYHLFQPRTKHVDRNLSFTRQVAVPTSLRLEVLQACHDNNFAGAHVGIDRVYANLRLRYFWRCMYSDVVAYVTSCDACQRAKRPIGKHRAPLQPLPAEGVFSRWHIDFLSLSTTTSGFKNILLVTDSFSKWPEAFCTKTQEASEVCDILYREVFARYGSPRTLVSDRGQNFLSKLVKELCAKFNVKRHYTSSFHAQSNASCERMNSSLLNAFRTYATAQTEWDKLLPGILAAYRAGVSTHSTEYSPFQLVFGKEMNLPIDNLLTPPTTASANIKQYIADLNQTLKVSAEIATENTKRQQERYKLNYDKTAAFPQYAIGDQCLLYDPKVPVGLAPKLRAKWTGPVVIIDIGPNYTYAVMDCKTRKRIKPLVHANRLRLYNAPQDRFLTQVAASQDAEPTMSQDDDSPPLPSPVDHADVRDSVNAPDAIQSTPVPPLQSPWFPVEKVLATKLINKKRFFNVKWKSPGPATWEPEANLSEQLIRQYYIDRQRLAQKRRKRRRQNQ
jgi:transposase InsO family protein